MALRSFDDLKEWTQYQRPSAVEQWLKRLKIPYSYDKEGRPITTDEAINSSLVGKTTKSEAVDNIMNNTNQNIERSITALGDLYKALDLLREEYISSPETYSLLAEGPIAQIETITNELNESTGLKDALVAHSMLS